MVSCWRPGGGRRSLFLSIGYLGSCPSREAILCLMRSHDNLPSGSYRAYRPNFVAFSRRESKGYMSRGGDFPAVLVGLPPIPALVVSSRASLFELVFS